MVSTLLSLIPSPVDVSVAVSELEIPAALRLTFTAVESLSLESLSPQSLAGLLYLILGALALWYAFASYEYVFSQSMSLLRGVLCFIVIILLMILAIIVFACGLVLLM